MKISRKILLAAIAALGVLLIGYGLIRQFTGFEPSEAMDKYVSDIVIIMALGLFVYSRKLLKEEKKANEKAVEPEETVIVEDEDKPHWEQDKKAADQEDV